MEKLLYIKDFKYKTILFYNNSEKTYKEPFNNVIEELCLKNYSTLKGRIDAIKAVFGFKYNVPIYISKENVFVKITQAEYILWVNVFFILDVCVESKHKCRIVFNNNHTVVVNGQRKNIIKIINRGQNVINKTF